MPLDATYVLPIRAASPPAAEFVTYLRDISTQCQLVIVDGSDPAVFAASRRAWGDFAEHVPPDPDLTYCNGKVNGVLTGVRRAHHEHIVLADDDVRYQAAELDQMVRLLGDADLVRPQNYFSPLPWYARWDTARTLINRAFGHDFPGTFAIRRSMLAKTGGYDGDALFENLELIRTVEAAGGRIASPLDLFVARQPPTFSYFRRQRVRQAYEELARPVRFCLSLAVLPGVILIRHRTHAVVALATASIVAAEAGGRRSGGAAVFPSRCSVMAPLWVAERSAYSWLALIQRIRGGCRFGERRVARAATPARPSVAAAGRRGT